MEAIETAIPRPLRTKLGVSRGFMAPDLLVLSKVTVLHGLRLNRVRMGTKCIGIGHD